MRSLLILSGIIGCQAVFKPADHAALKSAVDSCLIEDTGYRGQGSGSCPTFTASNDVTGYPYGAMGDWDVSQVQSLATMFDSAQVFNHDLSNWDVSQVTTLENTFAYAYVFNSDISGWDVSQVTTLRSTFVYCKIFDQDLSNWDISQVTSLYWTFFNIKANANLNIGLWNTSKVTTMRGTFYGTPHMIREHNHDVSSWDVSQVTSFRDMFYNAATFNQDISKWDVSSATSMYGMFDGARQFNSDISGWDVSKVTTFRLMFDYAKIFNQDLSSWDVSSVTSLYRTFYGADAFESDLSGWDISLVTDNTQWTYATDFATNEMAQCTMDLDKSGEKFQNCSLGGGSNSMKCKKGLGNVPTADVQSFTCGCDTGSYKNVDWATESDVPFDPDASPCFLCPVGTYQNVADQLSCKNCPSGTSTTVPGSKLENECLTAIDIKQKFLDTRQPALVPAYNIANSC